MKKISIITPCYNEKIALFECVDKVKKIFDKELKEYDYEQIICDNNSDTETIKILREIASVNKKIKIILNAKNYGSVKSTFNGIKNSSGDAVILLFAVTCKTLLKKLWI